MLQAGKGTDKATESRIAWCIWGPASGVPPMNYPGMVGGKTGKVDGVEQGKPSMMSQ